jgi:hypothetical protein
VRGLTAATDAAIDEILVWLGTNTSNMPGRHAPSAAGAG